MKIYVGTSGFGYKEWKGIFYPAKISPADMLRYYSGRFGSVEINNTFYRMPTEAVLSSWADQVPDDFVFAIKAPQVITHLKRLRSVGEEMEYFFRTLRVLGGKLGPVLFQFPASFHADHALLKDFLSTIPRDISCAFDFRSESWLDEKILELLHKKGCSLCIEGTDESSEGRIIGTTSWGYLRLRRSGYGDEDLSLWVDRVLSQKWKRAFVFFKHEEEAAGPELAMRFHKLIGSR